LWDRKVLHLSSVFAEVRPIDLCQSEDALDDRGSGHAGARRTIDEDEPLHDRRQLGFAGYRGGFPNGETIGSGR